MAKIRATISEDTQKSLREDLMEYEISRANGEDVDGIGSYLQGLVKKYEDDGVTFNIARHNYYKHVRGMFDEDAKKENEATEEDLAQYVINFEENGKENTTEEPPVKEDSTTGENTSKEEPKDARKGSTTVKSSKNIDDSISNFINDSSSTPKYLPGQRIKVHVNAVRHYGALVETMDGLTQGLIHISEVKDHFINDVHEFFKEGDEIEDVKIVKVEKDGKLSLSTVDTFLPRRHQSEQKQYEAEQATSLPNNPLAEKLADYKDQIESFTELDSSKQKNYNEEGINDELDEIANHIRGIVGALSPEAQAVLKDIKGESSTFKLSRAIFEVEGDFNPDLGLLFMQQVKKRMDEGL